MPASPTACSTTPAKPTRNCSFPRFCRSSDGEELVAPPPPPPPPPCGGGWEGGEPKPRMHMTPLAVRNVEKTFTMHLRDGLLLPVVEGVEFEVDAGECVVLGGPSGAGKSSLLKMVYGNYAVDRGEILVIHHG